MELDERVGNDPGHGGGAAVADRVELVADHRAVDPDRVECGLERHATHVGERAHHVGGEARPFLVGEEPHRDRTGGDEPGGGEGLDDLEPREHPEVAVVATAGGDGVDVTAGHDGCERRVAARWGPGGDDVADRVDRHVEPEVAHPPDHEIAPGAVGGGERQAGTAVGSLDRPDRGERCEVVDEPGTGNDEGVGGRHRW